MVFQGTNGFSEEEVSELVRGGHATGKVYTTYDARMEDWQIVPLMRMMERVGGLLLYHAEDDAELKRLRSDFEARGITGAGMWPLSRPDFCEADAVSEITALAWGSGAPSYIVHLSTAQGLQRILEAREKGCEVYAETCPQYLCLTDELYGEERGLDFKWLRLCVKKDCDALWAALASGDIDTVGTDHCSFSRADKIKFGSGNVSELRYPGHRTRMPILFSEESEGTHILERLLM